jgi:stage II sporulation protein D
VLQIGTTKIPTEDFRLAIGRTLGWNQIRSNWFEVSPQGESFLFHGRGSGHGVGLCQTGAAEMAGAGKPYREILAQYFPNAISAEETTGAPWQSLPGQNFTLETSDPTDRQYLPALTQALAEAQSRSGLHPNAPIAVRAYRSTPVFRDATLAPGWVAAFTEGNRIALQPLRILAARRLLAGTARHEFLHALVETESTPQTPLWLREGLVEIWSGEPIPPAKPAQSPDAISQQLAHAASLAESQQTHRAAAWYASQLLNRHGRAQTLAWLRAGVPQSALGNF